MSSKVAVSLISLFILFVTSLSCQDLVPAIPVTPTPAAPAGQGAARGKITSISTEEMAIFAVQDYLVSKALSYKAKNYLADYYSAARNWSAKSEILKDGTRIWRVYTDMSSVKDWSGKPYWKQAEWIIINPDKIIPSTSYEANAVRIEADIQALNAESK